MHIFLIRHGESIANSGENYDERLPDHLVGLTEKGHQQAFENGQKLKAYCDEKGISTEGARIWRSPYLRTRQTSEEFNKSLGITDIREDITLSEQQFGLFDSVPEAIWGDTRPDEYDEYLRQIQNNGKFYARMPLGESPYDVAVRVHQFIDTIRRDDRLHGVNNLFVFSHGTTMRAFLLRWFHYTPEWYQAEKNPKNCWVREIDDYNDLGYVIK